MNFPSTRVRCRGDILNAKVRRKGKFPIAKVRREVDVPSAKVRRLKIRGVLNLRR